MPAKDTVTVVCYVSDQMMHKLARYESKEGLKQTHVYERALERFFAWYESATLEELKHWRVLSSATGGKPYRGRIESELRTRMQEIADELRHPIIDLFYTALNGLLDSKDLEKIHLVNCFLDHSVYERCEDLVKSHYEDRSDFVETISTTYTTWYDSDQRPESYTIPISSYTGQTYPAYVSEAVYTRFEELANHQQLSIADVYHEALRHATQGANLEPMSVVTSLLPVNTFKSVNAYINDAQMAEGEFISHAVEAFLKWHKSASPEESWKPHPAPLGGEVFRGHVSDKLVTKLHKLPYPRLDLYSHAVRYYAHIRDIDPSPYLFAGEDHSPSATHGMAKIKVLPEQDKLIRLLMVTNDIRTLNEFCNLATTWWLEQRSKKEADEEVYFSRLSPTSSDSESDFVDIHLTTPYPLHAAMQAYAHEDTQSLRTVYYTAVIRYLDHHLDLDAMSQFINKMK